jgi:precorrin-6x reductase
MENRADVFVLAGTVDGRKIVEELSELNLTVVVSVTTGVGKLLIEGSSNSESIENKLSMEDMTDLINRRDVKCLVDATHPYAKEASINAIGACKITGIRYLRYEREGAILEYAGIVRVKSYEEAASAAYKREGNILLTTGSNNIEVFIREIPDYKDRLFVRVLPQSKVLEKCEGYGLFPGNIIAIKGPFTEEMNVEMLKYCNAKVLVTKESGREGGINEKVKAAEKLGIPVVLIERPDVMYPEKVNSASKVVRIIKDLFEEKHFI